MSGRLPQGESEENRHIHGRRPPSASQVLTPEEIKALSECNSESFWYRCVPFGMGLMAGTQLMVNKGILKPHPRFGALFKNMAAALVGFFLGKVSYQKECRQKIMALENSPLAESMRQGKRGREVVQDIFRQAPLGHIETDNSPRLREEGHMDRDIDTDSNVRYAGLNDSQRPSIDSLESDSKRYRERLEEEKAAGTVDYSELRKKNREAYKQQNEAESQAPRIRQRETHQASSQPDFQQPPTSVRRNQYGDIVEE